MIWFFSLSSTEISSNIQVKFVFYLKYEIILEETSDYNWPYVFHYDILIRVKKIYDAYHINNAFKVSSLIVEIFDVFQGVGTATTDIFNNNCILTNSSTLKICQGLQIITFHTWSEHLMTYDASFCDTFLNYNTCFRE